MTSLKHKVISRPCPVCGREFSLAEYKTVEQILDFFQKEDAYCLRLVEEMVNEHKAPSEQTH